MHTTEGNYQPRGPAAYASIFMRIEPSIHKHLREFYEIFYQLYKYLMQTCIMQCAISSM